MTIKDAVAQRKAIAMTTTGMLDREHWQYRLAELASKYKVPGAALGIALGDSSLEVPYGVTTLDAGIEVGTDTLFQIGSISKVWAATAVMALVEGGELNLDNPITAYLAEFELADRDATRQVTMRHLLTHTSGIEGDFFRDFGTRDDCLARYVAALADIPLNHPVGATWSYCNTGYDVAGRVVERVTGQVWDAAIKNLVFGPLGISDTVTVPADAPAHRVATGYFRNAFEEPTRAPWGQPRCLGPDGGIVSTVGDVLSFARLHLASGVAANGTRLLAAETVAAMQEHQATPPSQHLELNTQGLGWRRFHWQGGDLIGHDGVTPGQQAYLRVVPDKDMAVVLLTNCTYSNDLYRAIVGEVLRDLAGVEMLQPLNAPDAPVEVDASPYVGTYRRYGVTIDVWTVGADVRMRTTDHFPDLGLGKRVKEYYLVPVRDGLYFGREPASDAWAPVTFYSLGNGAPYVFFGNRATPKAA